MVLRVQVWKGLVCLMGAELGFYLDLHQIGSSPSLMYMRTKEVSVLWWESMDIGQQHPVVHWPV